MDGHFELYRSFATNKRITKSAPNKEFSILSYFYPSQALSHLVLKIVQHELNLHHNLVSTNIIFQFASPLIVTVGQLYYNFKFCRCHARNKIFDLFVTLIAVIFEET